MNKGKVREFMAANNIMAKELINYTIEILMEELHENADGISGELLEDAAMEEIMEAWSNAENPFP